MLRQVQRDNSQYPQNLRKLVNGSDSIWILGELIPSDARVIAVIGTRKMSAYGEAAVRNLVYDLVQAGFTIVSGMAPGIDSVAQETALSCGGRTIGVLGFGTFF